MTQYSSNNLDSARFGTAGIVNPPQASRAMSGLSQSNQFQPPTPDTRPHTLTHLPSSLVDVMTDIAIQQGLVDEMLEKLGGPSPVECSKNNSDQAEPVGLTELLHSQVLHIQVRLSQLTNSLYSLKSQIG